MKKFLSIIILCFVVSINAYAKDMRFVQITDVKYDTANKDNFSALIRDVNKQKNVSFVVFTGDNIQKPDKNNLKSFLKEADKLKKPYYMVLGDKDVNKHKKLSKKTYVKYAKKHFKHNNTNYLFESNDVVFCVVDGSRDVFPGSAGYYKDSTLEWLDSNIASYPNKNIIILQHFPIIPPNNNESYMTFKPEKYLEILNEHKNIKAVISGHYGVNKEQTVNGIVHISTAPAPNYRIIDVMNCDTDNPEIWAEVKEAE